MLATTKPSNSAAFTFLQQLHEKATTPPSSISGADEMEVETRNETNQGINQEIKVPTLNQILDKINEKGISSLSGFEKEILDEYSKN